MGYFWSHFLTKIFSELGKLGKVSYGLVQAKEAFVGLSTYFLLLSMFLRTALVHHGGYYFGTVLIFTVQYVTLIFI